MRRSCWRFAAVVGVMLVLAACGEGLQSIPPAEDGAPSADGGRAGGEVAGGEGDGGGGSTTTAPVVAPSRGHDEATAVQVLDASVDRTAAFETARFEVVVAADAERPTGLNPSGPLQATGELADFGAALRMEMVVEPVGARDDRLPAGELIRRS